MAYSASRTTMKTLRRLIAIALANAPIALLAQEGSIGSEHRYSFRLAQLPSAYQEKLVLESIHGLDPDMRTVMERPEAMLRILAYRPLDEQQLVQLAAQHGVALRPQRATVDPLPNTEDQ